MACLSPPSLSGLHILDNRGRRAQAMNIARDLFPMLYETNVTASRMESARSHLAALIAFG